MGEESPKNKVKFLCSYGGKVLPRPSDGLLRYVGGETRVVSVPRDITFAEVMKKVSGMVEGEMVLKYQLVPEDLDALVSVRTEEDVKHMIEEHDRGKGGAMLRAFLFPPSKPHLVASEEPYMLEQRYIDAINGIIRTSPRACNKPSASISASASACSSPKSMTSPDAADQCSPRFANLNVMHRVHSSPSLTNLTASSSPYPFLSRPLPHPHDPLLRRASPNYYYLNNRQTHTRAGYGYHDDSASYLNLPTHHTVSRSPGRRKSIWD